MYGLISLFPSVPASREPFRSVPGVRLRFHHASPSDTAELKRDRGNEELTLDSSTLFLPTAHYSELQLLACGTDLFPSSHTFIKKFDVVLLQPKSESSRVTKQTTVSIMSQSIFETAHARWLNVDEIVAVLTNAHESLCRGTTQPILVPEEAPPSSPPTSGTVLLYDRIAVRNYKVDGHDWIRKRSNQTKIREDHVKLRHHGEYRVGGTYVHSADVDTLHRRVYRLIKTAEEKAEAGRQELVLVHYLDTDLAAVVPSSRPGAKKRGIKSAPSSSSSSSRRTSGRTKKRSARMINADDDQQYNEPMPALPASFAMNEPKRIRTANSYAKVLEQQQYSPVKPIMTMPSYNNYYDAMAVKPTKPMPTLYQQLDWSSNGAPPATTAGTVPSSTTSSTPAATDSSSSVSDLDDVNFDDIFDMFSSDAALCEGLESLIDPAMATMQAQQTQVRQLPPSTFEMPILHRPSQQPKGIVTPEEEPAYMSRVVTADDLIPSVGV